MKNLSRIVLFLLTMLLIVRSHAQQDLQSTVKVYSVLEQKEIPLEELAHRLSDRDVIFFGEQHDDSIAHRLQLALYKQLIDLNPILTLSLEMFERDVQLVLDEYLGGHITEAKLREEGRAWDNYADYAPLVNLAKETGQQVVAANVPTRYANMVARKGLDSLKELPKQSKQHLPSLPLSTERPAYREKFDEAMGGHGHGAGASVFHAQLLRDATMAESLWRVWRKNKKTPILHLNGRFHSDSRLGTVEELRVLSSRIQIATISCFSVKDFDDPVWADYANLADIIILTKED